MSMACFDTVDFAHVCNVLKCPSSPVSPKEEQVLEKEFDFLINNGFRDMKSRITKGYCSKDVYDFVDWFITIIPDMLEDFMQNEHGFPAEFVDEDCTDEEKRRKWISILREIVYYFREANPETSSRQNPYEEEFNKEVTKSNAATERFRRQSESVNGSDFEEPNIAELYQKEEAVLIEYRNFCLHKAMALFSKWLPDLWL